MNWETLNPEQQAAVRHTEGPLLVFAGAGSGKTRVITYRIANLIMEHGVAPARILAVTFTNKAAEEMKTRLDDLLAGAARGLWVGTFHAICARILRESGQVIDIQPNFLVYDESDQVDTVRQVLRALNMDEKQFTPRSFLYAISRAKEKLISPEEFERNAYDFFDRLVAQVYPRYQEALKAANALDFDDLLLAAIRLFQQQPAVLERYQDRFQYILVDEYQDVNYAQYVLVQQLSGKHRNLCVVGDDDQSVYSFRGAEVELILRFQKDYPDATVIKLERNYRSTQPILDAAYRVVSQNKFRAQKKLWTDREEGKPLTLTRAQDEMEEARLVADYIQRMIMRGERRYSDFAVLYRTNAQSRAFEDFFMQARIPHRIVGALRFYDRKEIKDLLAYLRLIVNPDDAVSLRRVINVPPRGIGSQTVLQIQQTALLHNKGMWEVIRSEEFTGQLTARAKKSIQAFSDLIADLQQFSETHPVSELTKRVIERSGYLDWLRAEGSTESRDRAENIQEFLSVALQFEETSEDKSLLAFLQQSALVSDMDTLGTGGDQVLLMTLHTSKGLEFPVVFLVGLEEGVLPHARSDTPDQIEEERRLCYVGMTRAQDELHLLFAQARRSYSGYRWSQPSRFLKAIPQELTVPLHQVMFGARWEDGRMERQEDRRTGREEKLQTNTKQEATELTYLPGQRVRHSKFGMGVVIRTEPAVQGDAYITVMFPGAVGMKTLLASAANLEVLI